MWTKFSDELNKNNLFIMHWKIRCIHWFILCCHYFLFTVVPEISFMSVIRKMLSVLVGRYIWKQYGHVYGHTYDNLNWSIIVPMGYRDEREIAISFLCRLLCYWYTYITYYLQSQNYTNILLGLPMVISDRRHGRKKQSLGIRYVWKPDWF